MKISEAIKHLEELKEKHGDLRVGNCGHYGEFYPLDDDFAFGHREVDCENSPWTRIPKECVIHIATEDIGQEPD